MKPTIFNARAHLFRKLIRKLYIDALLLMLRDIILTKEEYNTLEVVPHVDLKKYLGKWYEIARAQVPTSYQNAHAIMSDSLSTRRLFASALHACMHDLI